MEAGAKNVEANFEAADAAAGPSALAEDELPVCSNASSLCNHDMSTDEYASSCRAFAGCSLLASKARLVLQVQAATSAPPEAVLWSTQCRLMMLVSLVQALAQAMKATKA